MPQTNLIDKSQVKQLTLEKELYQEAKKNNKTFSQLLGAMEEEEGYEAGDDGLDAFQRQLVAHGLPVQDARLTVEDFFKTNSSKVLFPEYISRNVYDGMRKGKMYLNLEDLYVSSQRISDGAAKQLGLDFDKERAKMKRTAEGSKFPVAKVVTKDKSIDLIKVGVVIGFTYESIRRMKVNLAGIMFRRMGYLMKKDVTREGLRVIVRGDGNTGSASATSTTPTTTPKYSDLVDCIMRLKEGHEPSHVVMPKEYLQHILTDKTNFPQFQSRGLLENFIENGDVSNFFGTTLKLHDDMAEKSMLAYERETCLELYEEAGGQLTETNKIIDEQIEQTAISYSFAFGKLFQAASHYKTKKP